MLLSINGHWTFVHYKLPPLNPYFVCWIQTLICSWWTNLLCYHAVALSVSQTNTTLSAWSCHMRRVIRQAIRANNREGGPTLKEFWKAVNNIGDSWAEIKESKMHACWMRLFPELVQGFRVLLCSDLVSEVSPQPSLSYRFYVHSLPFTQLKICNLSLLQYACNSDTVRYRLLWNLALQSLNHVQSMINVAWYLQRQRNWKVFGNWKQVSHMKQKLEKAEKYWMGSNSYHKWRGGKIQVLWDVMWCWLVCSYQVFE